MVFLNDKGGGGKSFVVDTWSGRGSRSSLCGSSLVVLPNDFGKAAAQEEDKTRITADFGEEQDAFKLNGAEIK